MKSLHSPYNPHFEPQPGMKPKWLREVQTCFWLSLPLATAQVLQAATGFVDTVMMGMLGSQAIAAGGLGATVFMGLLLIATAIVSAVSPMVAEAYGAGMDGRVRLVVQQGLLLAIALGIPLTLLLRNMEPILQGLGQSPDLIPLMGVYLKAVSWGAIPGLIVAVLRSFVSSLSKPRPVMIVVMLGTAINVVANYTLMFGLFGLPRLGLAGIGYASALSFWGMLLLLTGYILLNQELRLYPIFEGRFRLDPKCFRGLLQIGIPMGVLSLVEAGMFTLTTLLVGLLGTVPLAAHQIALQTAALTFMVPMGIGLGTTVQVGQRLGQKDALGMRLAGFAGIGLGGVFMLLMAIVIWLMPQTIVSLYLDVQDPANQEVVALAIRLLLVAAIFQIVDGVQVTATGALRGMQDTRIPMIIGIISYWGIGLTSGYLLGFHFGMGSVGLWLGWAVGLLAAATVLTWRFARASRLLR
ncbi:MAG: MATE family efflux transporter [Cyanobacteria bacterium J06638_20]